MPLSATNSGLKVSAGFYSFRKLDKYQFLEAMKNRPTSFYRANTALQNGAIDTAIALYQSALIEALEPMKVQIRFNLGIALKRAGNKSPVGDVLKKPGFLDDYLFDLIETKGAFDTEWYMAQYGEKFRIGSNPLAHYLNKGIEQGTNPSGDFDTAYYLKENPDVAAAEIHPFLHYVCQGMAEGRRPRPENNFSSLESYPVDEPRYVDRLPKGTKNVKKAVRAIAFYLPQFHPVPENDKWWGEGFTEWTNVRPAKPQFSGHYQPHVPDEALGYYDLRDASVMRKQVELARQYGIEGFCFYVYWFSGKRLLERPVDDYLNDTSLDQPFCICWANENWSRRWDGSEHEILMGQEYSDAHDIEFISDMAKYLRDTRYIRVQGKPLFIIYRPSLLPDMVKTARRWRQWCRENGIGEIYIAYVQSFENSSPEKYELDAAIEFPPSGWYAAPEKIDDIARSPGFTGNLFEWRNLVKRSESYQDARTSIIRGVCPSWDNTARRRGAATVFHRSSPRLFRRWLVNAFSDTVDRVKDPEDRLVFINAWNEWAEGAHLEPDNRYGYAWLEAVRIAHIEAVKPRIAVVTHDAFPAGAQMLCLHLAKNLEEHFGFSVHIVCLGTGELLPQFAQVGTLDVLNLEEMSRNSILEFSRSLKGKGVSLAIVNTCVSGKIIEYFKEAGISCLALVHEMPWLLSKYGLRDYADAIAAHADNVIFAAPQVRRGFEAFLGRPVAQSVILPQGLYQPNLLKCGIPEFEVRRDVRRRLGLPEDSKIVIGVGYADWRKGFDLFLRIGSHLMSRRSDVWFTWIGRQEAEFADDELSEIHRLGLENRFLFPGFVDEPQYYYLASDVYALTSREDPFPSVVMESLVSLSPVVAFEGAGGFEELLRRDCGVLVPKGDIQAFADALGSLLDDPVRSRRLAAFGKNIVEREFNFRSYVFDLLRLSSSPIPRVSAVIPNYNYEAFLAGRIDCVVKQSLPIYELIVLDDCSTDDSVSIANKKLSELDIPTRLLVNETNSGSVFRQWRKGVESSVGDYVWIAESDDDTASEFLEIVIQKMVETGADIGFSDSWQIDELGCRIGDGYKSYNNDGPAGVFDNSFHMRGDEFLREHLSIKNVILNVSGVVFNRKALLRAMDNLGEGLYDFKVAGDWRIYIQLCAAGGSVVYVADSLNGHRRHGSSVTSRLDVERHLGEIGTIHELDCFEPKSQELDQAQSLYRRAVKEYLVGRADCS